MAYSKDRGDRDADSDIGGPNLVGKCAMTMDAPIHPIIPPPAIYDHAYKGRLTVQQSTMAQVEHYCHTMHGITSPYQALGCTKVGEHRCFIMIPRIRGPVTASVQFQIRRHEIAHCNGWPANHAR